MTAQASAAHMFGSHLITLVAKAQKPAAKLLACEAMRPIRMLRTPRPPPHLTSCLHPLCLLGLSHLLPANWSADEPPLLRHAPPVPQNSDAGRIRRNYSSLIPTGGCGSSSGDPEKPVKTNQPWPNLAFSFELEGR